MDFVFFYYVAFMVYGSFEKIKKKVYPDTILISLILEIPIFLRVSQII